MWSRVKDKVTMGQCLFSGRGSSNVHVKALMEWMYEFYCDDGG